MSTLKRYSEVDVLAAAQARVSRVFDDFGRVCVSFSGGKDSTVMLHLVADEARRRGRRFGIMVIDLEAQYRLTMEHVAACLDECADVADAHWVCLPIKLRNAVSQYEPTWTCWDPAARELWVREIPDRPDVVSDPTALPFFIPGMEFEEFDVLFGDWYSRGEPTAILVGIRADESLNRFRTIASRTKETWRGLGWTTRITESVYNAYPIYDWRTSDVWTYHTRHPDRRHNELYDLMHRAGLSIHQQRICQPYGDDQRRGLWLYHLIEPGSWFKVVARVNGVNGGALYVTEMGNVMGYNRITKPEKHTWESFCRLLLASLPAKTRAHFQERFGVFVRGWRGRGYDRIPEEAPLELENAHWAPSWRRMCKVILRNDWWCKGLGLQQPKSEAYGRYLQSKAAPCSAPSAIE